MSLFSFLWSALRALWLVPSRRWPLSFAVLCVPWPVAGLGGLLGDAVLRWAFRRQR